MKRAVLLGLSILSLMFAGCSAPSGVTDSIVVNVTACQPAPDGAMVTLRYVNESVYALGISRASHKLYLDGRLVAELPSTPPVGVPPVKSAAQDVPVQFKDGAYVRQLAGSASAAAVPYRLDSVLYETIGENDFKKKLSVTGTLDLRPLAEK